MKKAKAAQIIRKIRQDYNAMATTWDASRFKPSLVKIKQLNGIKPKMKVLDIGCGNGLMVPFIIERGASYNGIDISRSLISRARKKYSTAVAKGQAAFVVGDVTKKLPFRSESFDRIICFAVLHHVPSEERRISMLAEMKRVLKPQGKASIIVWNLLNEWAANRFHVQRQLKSIASGLEPGDVYVPWKAVAGIIYQRYLHLFSSKELVGLARSAGFAKWRVGYYNKVGQREKNGPELIIQLNK